MLLILILIIIIIILVSINKEKLKNIVYSSGEKNKGNINNSCKTNLPTNCNKELPLKYNNINNINNYDGPVYDSYNRYVSRNTSSFLNEGINLYNIDSYWIGSPNDNCLNWTVGNKGIYPYNIKNNNNYNIDYYEYVNANIGNNKKLQIDTLSSCNKEHYNLCICQSDENISRNILGSLDYLNNYTLNNSQNPSVNIKPLHNIDNIILYEIIEGNLPNGLTFDSSTGIISGFQYNMGNENFIEKLKITGSIESGDYYESTFDIEFIKQSSYYLGRFHYLYNGISSKRTTTNDVIHNIIKSQISDVEMITPILPNNITKSQISHYTTDTYTLPVWCKVDYYSGIIYIYKDKLKTYISDPNNPDYFGPYNSATPYINMYLKNGNYYRCMFEYLNVNVSR